MDKINNTGKAVIIAAIVVVVILVAFIYGGSKSQAPQSGTNGTASNTAGAYSPMSTATVTNAGSQSGNAGSGSTGSRTIPPPPIVIHLITPVTNDQWKIGVANPISWDNAANFSGEIDLLDGKTNAFIGVILSETGSNQTSYSWDTREYFLSRYSPLKKEITAGTYKIRLKFDGNNLPSITSPAFTVIN